ncbi:hypothetical protein [Undibacterium sp. RuTC16W]|uniref:hypothetical protein n=1 Tax=Undibacterium sp. RuTC16W TaxID=3413048 RepID=UPI003BF2349E
MRTRLSLLLCLLSALNGCASDAPPMTRTAGESTPAPAHASPPPPSPPPPPPSPAYPAQAAPHRDTAKPPAQMPDLEAVTVTGVRATVNQQHKKAHKATLATVGAESGTPAAAGAERDDKLGPATNPATNPSSANDDALYLARVRADTRIPMKSSGEMQVWVGLASNVPAKEAGQAETQKTFSVDPQKRSAKIVPIAPDFEWKAIGKDCTELTPSGSEIPFSLTPKRLGKFKVSATVELYKSEDCSGTPKSVISQDTEITVSVDIKNNVQNGFWDLISQTWDEINKLYLGILAAISAAILVAAKEKIKTLFGLKNTDDQGKTK